MKKKIIAALLGLIMACTPFAVLVTSADTTTDNYKKQLSNLQEKEKEYQSQLSTAKSAIKNKKAYSKALEGQIGVLSEEIGAFHQQITSISTDIANKQRAIKEANGKIKNQMESLKVRVREIYMAGDTSDIDIILGAKDFSDFLDKYELIKDLSAYDRKLISSVESQMDVIVTEKAELVKEREELKKSEGLLKSKQNKLSKLLEKNQKVLSELYKDKNTAESFLRRTNAQESEIKRQLESYYKKLQESQNVPNNAGGNNSNNNSNTNTNMTISKSGFVWPVPGHYLLSSPYAENRGYSHKGIDISGGIMGATVVAASGGTVIASNNTCKHNYGKSGSCGCGGGYGNYVIISHQGGKTTIYGHLTSAVVSTGASVSRGQTIGYAGTTGWSTGPHLHFETRLNGTPYNPMSEY